MIFKKCRYIYLTMEFTMKCGVVRDSMRKLYPRTAAKPIRGCVRLSILDSISLDIRYKLQVFLSVVAVNACTRIPWDPAYYLNEVDSP